MTVIKIIKLSYLLKLCVNKTPTFFNYYFTIFLKCLDDNLFTNFA